MSGNLNALYQAIILDHNRNPRNFRRIDGATGVAEGNNPLCGDRFTVFVTLRDDVIAEAAFQGAGCAISKAAASLMTEAVSGKSAAEARELSRKLQSMLKRGDEPELPEPLRALSGVRKFRGRIKCALLPWQAMEAALQGSGAVVSTEESE